MMTLVLKLLALPPPFRQFILKFRNNHKNCQPSFVKTVNQLIKESNNKAGMKILKEIHLT